ncbi:MAG TPA: lipid-A-disaccharide synthase [Firmicutes bacterium]|nr:lipid-A-disaccharide synthase [Bacillota bacterium]
MKIMLVAGEPSGDLHGARLAKAILEQNPAVELFGLGGPLMAEAGVRLIADPTAVSLIGFVEVFQHVRYLLRLLKQAAHILRLQRPDAVVFIDFPEFNMRLAKVAKGLGVPSLYYFSPSVWAWRRGRAKKLGKLVDMVAAVFPFEADIYRRAGAEVIYLGHPLLDTVQPSMDEVEIHRFLNIVPEAMKIALMPGSRRQEIKAHLPTMLEAGRLIQEQVQRPVQYLVPVAAGIDDELIREVIAQRGEGLNLRLVHGYQYDVLAVADLVIVACGTATLEAALLEVPMVTVYRLSKTTYRIAKLLVKVPHVALPNVIAGREIVPELIQDEFTPETVVRAAMPLLQGEAREEQRKALAQVKVTLGPPGAVARCAALVLKLAAERGVDPRG